MGHYAMPLMVGARVLGWANLQVQRGRLHAQIGFVQAMNQHPTLQHETQAELARFAQFMRLAQTDAAISRHPNSAW
jgi:uncharacterized protein YcaQ